MAVNSVIGTYGINPAGYAGSEKIKNVGENEKGMSFAQYIENAIEQVNQLQLESQKVGNDFAMGKADMLEVMVSSYKADIAFQFTTQIRNKIMDAYSEIMRMQI